MDDEDTLKRAIQASADEDVASFIESLDKDVGTGIPDPPKIVIDEVSATPAELELMPFGTSGSQTQPHGAGSPPPPVEVVGACCIDEDCSIRAEGQCDAMGGVYQGDDTECEPNPCAVGACCVDDVFCNELSEDNCASLDGVFLGDVPCSPNPCACPSPLSPSFDVQFRVHGSIPFHHCSEPDCEDETVDTQSIDFTVNLVDNGNGTAEVQLSSGSPFPCGVDDIYARADLTCCNPPDGGLCSICYQDDYVWQIRLYVNMFFCNSYTPVEDCEPPDTGIAQSQLAMWDTVCEFNATYGLIQAAVYPFPNGVYTGTTNMTEQGGTGASCDSRPPVGSGGIEVGEISIDWQATITP